MLTDYDMQDWILWPVFNLGKLKKETEVWRRENA